MLYKDLTPEQQELLDEIILQYGEIPDDATHIDDETSLVCDTMLKFVGGVEFFFIPEEKRWKMAGAGLKAKSYFQIPEDFCRKTGKVIDSKLKETTFPDFPFKLSCGDRPEVRQWLKDNGCEWSNGNDITKDHNFRFQVKNQENAKILWVDTGDDEKRKVFIGTLSPESYIEIEPTIKVTGYTLTESSKSRKETIEKITELRNNLEVIQTEIKKLEESLK